MSKSKQYISVMLYCYSKRARTPATAKQIDELTCLMRQHQQDLNDLWDQPCTDRTLSKTTADQLINRLTHDNILSIKKYKDELGDLGKQAKY